MGSKSLKVAKAYQRYFSELGIEAQLFSLEEFHSFHRDEAYLELEAKYLAPAEKFVFVLPEYNGSFPGIFKLMMDISDLDKCWNHKKVMLVGVASGRSGNLRGIDIMTNMCNYMKMHVYHHKLPISSVDKEIPENEFIHEHTVHEIKRQIQGFIKY